MTAVAQHPVLGWDGPAAVAPRGTLIIVPGRGEHPGVYERFGTRLAFDGYRVRAVTDPTRDATGAQQQVADLLADAQLPAPRVLIGSDAGALFALVQASSGRIELDGLVLAGLLTDEAAPPAAAASDWPDELAARTACPTHAARLDHDAELERGALGNPAPAEWFAAADLAAAGVPVLGLHGTDDQVSPLAGVAPRYRAAGNSTLVTIAEGRHDALNDATHRTAAATVVLFLERLRLGAQLPVITRSEG